MVVNLRRCIDLTDFPTPSAFYLNVGIPTCILRPVPTCRHYHKLYLFIIFHSNRYGCFPLLQYVSFTNAEFISVRCFRIQHFCATVCKTVRPKLPDRCLSCLFVCNVSVLWPKGWMDQDDTWYGSRPRPRRHYAIDGDPAPPPKGAQQPAPPALAHVYCGQTVTRLNNC